MSVARGVNIEEIYRTFCARTSLCIYQFFSVAKCRKLYGRIMPVAFRVNIEEIYPEIFMPGLIIAFHHQFCNLQFKFYNSAFAECRRVASLHCKVKIENIKS
jgi:hypothetical protein